MNLKKNSAIVFLVLLLFISCNRTIKRTSAQTDSHTCIQQVLAIDDSLGNKRNHECEQITLSETIKNYIQGLRQINFDDCPVEFRSAFENHIQAWSNLTKVTDKYPEKRGEMHVLFDEIRNGKDSLQFNKYIGSVWNTWYEIEEMSK